MVRRIFAFLLAAALLCAPQFARSQDRPAFSPQELDQMLAPIALYPDALLSQILMAATYPLEVVEAARWSAANPGLDGERAVRAVERNDWDPSVKSMAAFPQILAMMGARLDWTQRLGDAFLGQEPQVMDAVQGLRQKAYAAGNLRSNDQYRVDTQGQYISVEQAYPDMAYVPYYDPSQVYGQWWWPQYPPVYWAPWAGYRARPGFGAGLLWGLGIRLGVDFFFGDFDWRQRRVAVVNVNNFYHPRDWNVAPRGANAWQHDPNHRRSVPYRAEAVRANVGRTRAATAHAAPVRDAAAPAVRVAPAPAVREAPAPAPRETSAPAGSRPTEVRRDFRGRQPADAGPRDLRVDPSAAAPPQGRPAVESRPHVLEGVGRGREERNASARGRTSIQAPISPVSVPAPAPTAQPVASPRAPERAAAARQTERVAAPRPREPEAARPAEKARDRREGLPVTK